MPQTEGVPALRVQVHFCRRANLRSRCIVGQRLIIESVPVVHALLVGINAGLSPGHASCSLASGENGSANLRPTTDWLRKLRQCQNKRESSP